MAKFVFNIVLSTYESDFDTWIYFKLQLYQKTDYRCNLHFPGNETKLGMSRGVPEPKLTAMDAMIDKLTGAIFLFQLTVVVVLGAAGNVWKDIEARKVVFLVNFLTMSYMLASLLLVHWLLAKINYCKM